MKGQIIALLRDLTAGYRREHFTFAIANRICQKTAAFVDECPNIGDGPLRGREMLSK
jgi:hypothetical protein